MWNNKAWISPHGWSVTPAENGNNTSTNIKLRMRYKLQKQEAQSIIPSAALCITLQQPKHQPELHLAGLGSATGCTRSWPSCHCIIAVWEELTLSLICKSYSCMIRLWLWKLYQLCWWKFKCRKHTGLTKSDSFGTKGLHSCLQPLRKQAVKTHSDLCKRQRTAHCSSKDTNAASEFKISCSIVLVMSSSAKKATLIPHQLH